MRERVASIRHRLGDFWFHSLMLFLASRVADGLNFFVGAYLVPRFIDPNELGAVMPLATFATCLALPAYAFAMTFMKEVNRLATAGELGRLKSLMRGVFVAAAVFLVIGIVIVRWVLPHYLVRLRVMENSLGLMLIVYAFVGCVSPIYANALQALKKFGTMSAISILGAPVRMLTMLVAMPIRPLAGFFAGQSATPTFTMVASVVALRRELAVRAERYWTGPVARRFGWLFVGILAYLLAGMLLGLEQQTVLRERLPALDSAAYYLVSRFSDITSFVTSALLITLFPYTAELTEQGRSPRRLVRRSALVLLAVAAGLAIVFALGGRPLLVLLPHGREYAAFHWAIPWLVGITALGGVQCIYTNTEVAAGGFGFLKWFLPYHLLMGIAMLAVTERGWGPAWLAIDSLPSLLGWLSVDAVLKFALAIGYDRFAAGTTARTIVRTRSN